MEFGDAVEAYMEKSSMYHMEGEQGVRNLEQIVLTLGYNSIHEFLTDNAFAQQAIVEALINMPFPPAEWTETMNETIAPSEHLFEDPEFEPFEEDPEGDGTLPSTLPKMEYYSEE